MEQKWVAVKPDYRQRMNPAVVVPPSKPAVVTHRPFWKKAAPYVLIGVAGYAIGRAADDGDVTVVNLTTKCKKKGR